LDEETRKYADPKLVAELSSSRRENFDLVAERSVLKQKIASLEHEVRRQAEKIKELESELARAKPVENNSRNLMSF
jgi:uncharacterized protein YlxW (UPF0749 family)